MLFVGGGAATRTFPQRARRIRAQLCVQICVQFAPVLLVHGAVKVLVEVAGTIAMNVCGLGADIF